MGVLDPEELHDVAARFGVGEAHYYDLWALAAAGLIDDEAAALFSQHGPLTRARDVSFSRIPTPQEWETALAHQCIPLVTAQEAAAVVASAWSR